MSDNVWVQPPDWRKDAQAMSDAAISAVNAAKTKDFAALVADQRQNRRLVRNLPQAIQPELPTEGIAHTHQH